MTTYKITITYQTGDSFHTEQAVDDISITWEDLEVAKKALAWVKDLDIVTNRHKSSWSIPYDERRKEILTLPCACSEFPEVAMMLPRDDGTLRQISTFWRGHFERLLCAEIVAEDPDIRYIPD